MLAVVYDAARRLRGPRGPRPRARSRRDAASRWSRSASAAPTCTSTTAASARVPADPRPRGRRRRRPARRRGHRFRGRRAGHRQPERPLRPLRLLPGRPARSLCDAPPGSGSNRPGILRRVRRRAGGAGLLRRGPASWTPPCFTEPAACAMHGLETLRPRGRAPARWSSAPARPACCSPSSWPPAAPPSHRRRPVPVQARHRGRALGIDQHRPDRPTETRRAMSPETARAPSGGDGYDIVVEATGRRRSATAACR